MSEPNVLYIVDGSYYIYRAYFALRGLSNSKGFPTNALYGFVAMLQKLIAEELPKHLIVTFDAGGQSFRRDIYPQYKATRRQMPDDLVPQLPFFREIVEAYNLPVIEQQGCEADDVMATLSAQALEMGFDVLLVTGDKDLNQLVSPRLTLWDPMRDKRTGVEDVRDRFGVGPESVRDIMALWGDTTDNIPGVPGVGEKTAAKLIAEYGSLERLYDHVDQVSAKKLHENLVTYRDQAFLSRELVTMRTNIDVSFSPEKALVGKPDLARLTPLFKELEFTRYVTVLEAQYGALGDSASPEQAKVTYEPTQVSVVASLEELEGLLSRATKSGRVALRLDLTSSEPMRAKVVGIALSTEAGQGAYVGLTAESLPKRAKLTADAATQAIRRLLEDSAVRKVGYNLKSDWIASRQAGVDLNGLAFDVLLASYLLDPSRANHGLDVLATDYLGKRAGAAPAESPPVGQGTLDLDAPRGRAEALAEEADLVGVLSTALMPLLETQGLLSLHDDLELPLTVVLAGMERAGVLVDSQALQALTREWQTRLDEMERQIHGIAGGPFNINSPKQLAHLLFETLQLPVIKKTKSGPSTDQDVLEQLAEQHPLPRAIVAYRQLSKLKSTYTDTLPQLIHPITGRIHTDYRQAVAATGRLSSNNPNLQNIPVRTEEGRRIRAAFIPPPGKVLLSADYSQVELRLLAHMSKEPVLTDAFRKGQDIHARTAQEIFDVAPDQITKGQRALAKTINFGVLYGMGPVRLSREAGLTREEARRFIQRYFQRIAGVRDFLQGLVHEAKLTGYAKTLLGRRRPLPELRSSNQGQRALGERLAVNAPIQGTAADIIKLAMVNIEKKLAQSPIAATMLMQVHDELVFEVVKADAEALAALVKQEMEHAVELDVPLGVEVSWGGNWAAL